MEKALKIILIILAVVVGLILLGTALGIISTVLNFITSNEIIFYIVLTIICGVIVLMLGKSVNSEIRGIAYLLLALSILNLIGIFIASLFD
jgi:hypothetical protein